jgi:hypothetical protein
MELVVDKVALDGFFSKYFGFPLLVLFSQCSVLIYFSIADAMGLSTVG